MVCFNNPTNIRLKNNKYKLEVAPIIVYEIADPRNEARRISLLGAKSHTNPMIKLAKN
jgi:hypothetical protein